MTHNERIQRCPSRLFPTKLEPEPASVFVRAITQMFEEAQDDVELRRLGDRLKTDELASNAEKRQLRKVYAECMRALRIVELSNGETVEGQELLPDDQGGARGVEAAV